MYIDTDQEVDALDPTLWGICSRPLDIWIRFSKIHTWSWFQYIWENFAIEIKIIAISHPHTSALYEPWNHD